MAQDISSTSLAVTSETNAKPCYKVEVAWGKKWSDTIAGGDWIDETSRVVLPLSVNRDLADPDEGFTMVGQNISAQATVTLHNDSERYSPFNSSSPIYSSIRDGQLRNTPIRIGMGFHDISELVTNGGMELDSNWSNLGSPTTNERSSTQARFGTYSRHVVGDEHNDGIFGTPRFTTIDGISYLFEAWLYVVSVTSTNIAVTFGSGDDVSFTTVGTTTTTGSWVKISKIITEANEGSQARMLVTQNGAGASEFYVDGVSVRAVENPELLRQFTGLITSQPPASVIGGTVTWNCLGRSEAIKDLQGKTTIYQDITLTDWVEVLASEAGIAAGDQNFDIDDAELQWIWLDDEFIWMKMQEAAEAAGGMIYFDHSGVLRFESMQHWIDGDDHRTSQYSYTTSKFTDLQPSYGHSDGYSSVVVEYIRRDESYVETVWEDDDPSLIPPGESIKRTARLDYPCSTVETPEADTDYSCISRSGSAKNDDATVTMTAYAAQAELEIANDNAVYAIIATGLRLRGRPLLGGPNAEVKKVTAAGYITDTKEFPIKGNQCIQSYAQAERLSTFYRDRFERVPCVFIIPPSPAKPWLELGDRMTAVETDHGINHDAYIVGATYEIDASHYFSMSLRCLEAQYLYPVATFYNWADNLENLTVSTIDNSAMTLGHANRQKIAGSFTPASTFTCRGIALNLVRTGTPGGRVRVVIYSDSGGLPDAVITGGTSRWLDTGDIGTASTLFPGQWHPFPFLDEPSLTGSTKYHAALEYDSDYSYSAGVDEIAWRSDNVPSGGNGTVYNGSVWSANATEEMSGMEYALPLFY